MPLVDPLICQGFAGLTMAQVDSLQQTSDTLSVTHLAPGVCINGDCGSHV